MTPAAALRGLPGARPAPGAAPGAATRAGTGATTDKEGLT
jgi:hypothetical protein